MSYTVGALHEVEKAFALRQGIDPAALAPIHALRLKQQSLPDAPHKMAAWIAAPVLAGFTAFMAERAQGEYLGVMREGRLLCRLMEKLYGIRAREVWLNRNLSMLAAFGCGDDEALVNWLVRTRNKPISYAQAIRQLTGEIDARNQVIGLNDAYDLLRNGPFVAKARARSAALADRMAHHWRAVAGKGGACCLMDFACAGNIQRSLETVLKAKEFNPIIIGLNFSMTVGSKWAKEKGCIMRGYLAQKGEPAWFAQAYARTPELMEVFAASPLGPLEDYTEEGDPVCGQSFLSAPQRALVESLQAAILDAASLYHRELKGGISDDLARCLWGRLLLQPLPEEIEAFAEWPLDAGLDGSAQRKLVTQGMWAKR